MRLLLIMIAAVFACGCSSYRGQEMQSQPLPPSTTQRVATPHIEAAALNGVYELVSDTTSITAPEQSTNRVTANEWKGLWFFQNGYFSQTLMNAERPEWTPARFPTDAKGTGFDGASGTYSLEGGTVELEYRLTFYPGKTYTRDIMLYRLEGDTLTLTKELYPHREDLSEGQRVIILRKIQ